MCENNKNLEENLKLNIKDTNPENITFSINPIGYIYSSAKNKFDAPSQPNYQTNSQTQELSKIKLLPESPYYQATKDLESFSHIWLLWIFHKNKSWKPYVRPPRGPAIKRGVFATRSPHRPNKIGMSVVELVSVKKNIITIGSHDLIDGTPIIDIKPYIPSIDSFPNATSGWLHEVNLIENSLPKPSNTKNFIIKLSEQAQKQLDWLTENNINFYERAATILENNPYEHKTRRIKKISANNFRIGCGGWRIFYSINENILNIENFHSGYPLKNLTIDKKNTIIDYDKHLNFYEIFINSTIQN